MVNQATAAQVEASADRFGIRFLYPTQPAGTYWVSDWSRYREFTGIDPDDPWFDAGHGAGAYTAGGGELEIEGRAPRMYIHDPGEVRQWRDVEITAYVRRTSDTGIPFAGFTAVARSNHLRTEDGQADRCDTRGYGGRLRFDGSTDFEKETSHPYNQAIGGTEVFPDGMPRGVWIGVKYVVFDRADGVHLEMWLDLGHGRRGGHWELVNELVDTGDLFGRIPCAPGVDAAMALTHAPDRVGSESGRPNISVYFRSDGIGPQGFAYKWASVREIAA